MSEVILKFIIGLVILLFSTQKLVKLAEKISRVLQISPLIVGITIVALGTSLPELVVSVVSAYRNDLGLAMGNIIGSNIVNVLLVLPIGIFIGNLRIGTTKTQRNALILLVATVIFFLVQSSGFPRLVSGLILIGLAILVSFLVYHLGIIGKNHEDLNKYTPTKNDKVQKHTLLIVLLLVVGIITGGFLIVDSIETISLLTGISTTILGLTLTSVATSLPELLTTIFSQKDKQEKITIGNIIGSNIYNLLLVGGIITLFSTVTIINLKEWFWLGTTTLGFFFILKYYRGKKPSKWIGLLLITLFFVYLLTQ